MENRLSEVLKSNQLTKDFSISTEKLNNVNAKLVTLNEGEILFNVGDPADTAYLVVDGEIKYISKDDFGIEKIETFLSDTYFGVEAADETVSRNSKAVAAIGTYLLAISNYEIEELRKPESDSETISEDQETISTDDFTADEEIKSPFFDDEEDQDDTSFNLETEDQDLLSNSFLDDSMDDTAHIYETSSDESFEKDERADTEPVESRAEPEFEPGIKEEDEIEFENIDFSDKTAEQIEKINNAAVYVNSELKIELVLEKIVKVAADLANADRGLLFLTEKDSEDIWAKTEVDGDVKEVRLKIGEGIAGSVAETGEVVNIDDVSNHENFSNTYDDLANYETKSMICIPIKNRKGEVRGVLQLLNSKEGQFTKLDEESLRALSIHAALALDKATMHEKLLQTERVSSIGKVANFLIQDIKKPLLVSKRYAEHLKSKELPENAVQIVDMLLEQLNQVVGLVQATSGYSEGKTILRAINVSINDLLVDYTERMKDYLSEVKCSIKHDFGDDAKVKIDSKEFYQCFNNIVKNGCEAMPNGGDVVITTKIDDGKINITFTDSGHGIKNSIAEDVFEPFTSFGKVNSAGLGLAITKKITEAHDGKVSLESTVGKGTSVTIELPVASAF
ncbi:MAG: GAF domain-containing protein [Ignavibacteriae bacterium]|nr:GAF domain-containing protein [Ignavibacteriota bacterium]